MWPVKSGCSLEISGAPHVACITGKRKTPTSAVQYRRSIKVPGGFAVVIRGETDHQFFGRFYDWWTKAVLAVKGSAKSTGVPPIGGHNMEELEIHDDQLCRAALAILEQRGIAVSPARMKLSYHIRTGTFIIRVPGHMHKITLESMADVYNHLQPTIAAP